MIADIIILLFLSCIPFIWLSGGHVLAGYDSGFRFTGLTHITNLLQSWNFIQNYGTNWSIYRAFAVLQFPEALLTTITGSLHTAEALTFAGWFLAMAGSMYVLIRRVFPEKKFRFFRLYGAVFYAVNFFVLNGWLNAERAKFSLYAALPIAILLLFEEAFGKRKILVHTILFGLLYAVWNGGGSPPLFGASFVTLGIVGLCFVIFQWIAHGKKAALKLCGIYLLFIVSFLLWNAYWILPLIHLTSGSYTNAVASQGGIGGLIEWEKVFSKYASLTNLLRLQGFPDWYDNVSHAYANTFLQNPILIIGSFFPAITMLFGTRRFGIRDGKRTPFLVALFVLLVFGLVFAAGSHPPTGYVYILLMKYLPGFAVFRSSFYKFAPAVWISVITLSGYYCSLIIDQYGKKTILKTSMWIMILLGILIYHFPFYQNTSFAIPNGFTTRVKIPDYVDSMKQEIEQQTTINDRIFLLPDLDPGFITLPMDAYTWGFYSADILPRMLTSRSFIAGDANDDGITRRMYQDIYTGNNEEFMNLASISGITYMLWRGDIRQSNTAFAAHPLKSQKRMLDSMPNMQITAQAGPWILYKLNMQARPMIYQTNHPVTVTGNVIGDIFTIGNNTVLRTSSEIAKAATHMIGLECVMCDQNEYTKFESGIYLPSSNDSFLSNLKSIIRPKSDDVSKKTTEQIDDVLSNLLGTVSQVVYETDQSAMEKIPVFVNELKTRFQQLTGRDRIVYANRLYAYMQAIDRLTTTSKNALEIAAVVKPFQDTLEELVFVSDEKTFRYIVTIPSAGIYHLISSNPIQSVLLNRQTYIGVGQSVWLSEGLHTVELTRFGSSATPYLFFAIGDVQQSSVDSVSYQRKSAGYYSGLIQSSESAILVLNQRYDSDWMLTLMENGKMMTISKHSEANGFANAWILPDGYTGPFELRYR